MSTPIRRALLSVYDKTGIVELARALHAAKVEIVSTGSTAATIAAADIPVVEVATVTDFPECLDGRVKTLHPRIHAGILADQSNPQHLAELAHLEVSPFGLVVCNLYPFAATVSNGGSNAEIIEQIDIGGPTMVRAAAKNFAVVAVVTSPSQYEKVQAALAYGGFTRSQRQQLAADAFAHTATYDVLVARWFGNQVWGHPDSDHPRFPEQEAAQAAGQIRESSPAQITGPWIGSTWQQAGILRYGENPHQQAALYRDDDAVGIAHARVVAGKPMSYNNYVDADAAWRAAWDHEEPAVAVIKHANPCGIAVGETIADAYHKAHACDPVSAFGGVIAANRPVSLEMAQAVVNVFTEVLMATAFEPGVLEVLATKKNLRVLQMPGAPVRVGIEMRPVSGGLLVQEKDAIAASGDDRENWTLVAGPAADEATLADLEFAWRAVRAVKSNAILLAAKGAAVGIGMGQVNRVDSCRLAVSRAGQERARGAVAASDAFFPFPDGPQILFDAGVHAIVQPGGSMRDDLTFAAASAAGVSMYVTGTRHFAH